MRIRVDPDQLRNTARHFQGTAQQLDALSRRISSLLYYMDWEVRAQADIDQRVALVRDRVHLLAGQASALAQLLDLKAQGFEAEDAQGSRLIAALGDATVRLHQSMSRQSWNRVPAHVVEPYLRLGAITRSPAPEAPSGSAASSAPRFVQPQGDSKAHPEVAPGSGEQTSGPRFVESSDGPRFIKRSNGPTFIEQSDGPTFVEGSDSPTFIEQSDGPTFVEGSDSLTFADTSGGSTSTTTFVESSNGSEPARDDTAEQTQRVADAPATGEPRTEDAESSGFAALTKTPSRHLDAPLTSEAGSRDPDLYEAVLDQFEVENNPRYLKNQQGLGETYCNIYMWDATRAMGAEIPHWIDAEGNPTADFTGREMRANDHYAWLRDHGARFGWRAVSPQEAQEMANQGHPAMGVWRNPGGIGHVVMVRPGLEDVGSDGPLIAQAGLRNVSAIRAGDIFFGKLPEVVFYVHD